MSSLPSSEKLSDLPRLLVGAVALVVVFVYAYLYGLFGYLTAYGPHLSVVQSMMKLYKYEEWAHCALVPFIIVGLIVWDRKRLAAIPVRPSFWGLLPILAGFAAFWVSYRLDDIYFAFISAQLLTAGTVIFFLGWRWMLGLLFPWLFLAFAWPLFFLDNVIAFPLRLVMSTLSVTALNALGLHSVQMGTAILSAADPITGLAAGKKFQVDVADPCSGMRSLFALTMVSALYGYFILNTWWKHLLLVICAVPLAILGNLARILILTFGILTLGPETAIGSLEHPTFYHMVAGYFVFIVALGGMLIVAATLRGDALDWLRQTLKTALANQNASAASPQNADRTAGLPAGKDIY